MNFGFTELVEKCFQLVGLDGVIRNDHSFAVPFIKRTDHTGVLFMELLLKEYFDVEIGKGFIAVLSFREKIELGWWWSIHKF